MPDTAPGTRADPAAGLLRTLFPSDVGLCLSTALPPDATLFAEEERYTTGMVPKRLREFTHGRHCARQALAELNLPPTAIGRSAARAPVWPAGVVGSISHSGDLAAAVAGHRRTYEGLGLDVEDAAPLEASLRTMICRPDEAAGDGEQAKLLFAIKEAVYKSLYPTVQAYIDFLEMHISLSADGRFTAQSRCPHCDPRITARLEGRYARSGGRVFAAAWLPAL